MIDTSIVKFFGEHEAKVVQQFERCLIEGSRGVLCADAHFGYSQPVGAAVAYRNHISPSGVGYDIGCGNKAVRTPVKASDVDVPRVMDEIKARISFGIGRKNAEPVDHPILGRILDAEFHLQRTLFVTASSQLGTVGAGNHYIDLLKDEEEMLWIGVHFGSRGFGQRTASGFMAMAQGKTFNDRPSGGEIETPPLLFEADTPMGQDYVAAMELAGAYAYAGRDVVVDKVLGILGTHATDEVHNHHNFAWRERHFDEDWWVVRKGCTPAFDGQRGFVGGSMGDISVILEGVDSPASREALFSTVHGAGRVMSRTQAKGKFRKGKRISKGVVDWDAVNRQIKEQGIVLRGGDADEAPEVYRSLQQVLAAHAGTIWVRHVLRPIGVAMAGYDEYDPFKD